MLSHRRIRRGRVTIGLKAAVLTLGLASLGWAQAGTETQRWLRVETVQVKPERWTEFRQLHRDEVMPALRKGGVPSQAAWRTAEFGSTYEMVLVTPFDDFAFFDTGDLFGRVLGPRDAERLREKIRAGLYSRSIAVLRPRTDLSAGEAVRPFAVVATMTVAPGRGLEFESYLKKTLPTVAKAGIVFGVYEKVFGEPNAWVLVQNLDSLRELGLPDAIQRAFGPQAANRLDAELAGVLTSVERKVFRFDPELSFSFPSPPAAGR